jgi:uncharacterized protein (DUF433 family)
MPARIVIDPAICSGKPVIRGTRIMAHQIPSMIAGGYSIDDVLRDFPQLTRDDVVAALEWAVELMLAQRVAAVPVG